MALLGIFFVYFLCFLPLVIVSGQSGFLSLDCGASKSYTDTRGVSWTPDNDYISSGSTAKLTLSSSTAFLQNVRFFSNSTTKNCYSLPVTSTSRQLVRASFHYGNYDGLGIWPTFYLQIDGNAWAKVSSNLSQEQDNTFIYYELILTPQKSNLSLCLSSPDSSDVPFISAIELRPLPAGSYNSSGSFYHTFRYNFGGSSTLSFPNDTHDRFWDVDSSLPASSSIIQSSGSITPQSGNDPPADVIKTAIQGPTDLSPLTLLIPIKSNLSTGYFVLYFMDFRTRSVGDYCIFDLLAEFGGISLSDKVQLLEATEFEYVMNFDTSSSLDNEVRSLNLTLVPNDGATLAPILNAIEGFMLRNSGDTSDFSPPSSPPSPPPPPGSKAPSPPAAAAPPPPPPHAGAKGRALISTTLVHIELGLLIVCLFL